MNREQLVMGLHPDLVEQLKKAAWMFLSAIKTEDRDRDAIAFESMPGKLLDSFEAFRVFMIALRFWQSKGITPGDLDLLEQTLARTEEYLARNNDEDARCRMLEKLIPLSERLQALVQRELKTLKESKGEG